MATTTKKKPTNPILDAIHAATADEASAVEFLERHRWGDAPGCPREGCGSMDVYKVTGRDGARNVDFRWRCRGCGRFYTVRTNTPIEESRLPIRVWLWCYWSACASKKGVSAMQISREMQISYKSALFVMHRLRRVMATDGLQPKLSGTVEADEIYIGGKPRNKGPWNKRGPANKIPVIGIVQRGGDIRYQVMERVTAEGIKEALAANVEQSARLITDESRAYTRAGREFSGGHETVAHKAKEYARGEIDSNTVEGAFSLLVRGMIGTFHSVSKKHLHRYVAEFEFRHNTRKLDDGERIVRAIQSSGGKRLTYAQQVGG
jgi:transposase-like protein